MHLGNCVCVLYQRDDGIREREREREKGLRLEMSCGLVYIYERDGVLTRRWGVCSERLSRRFLVMPQGGVVGEMQEVQFGLS